jgi:predicted ATP-grasp superfamily ATP-dependent carboligase
MHAFVANAKSPPALAVIRSLGRRNIVVTGASDSKYDFPLYSKYCTHKIILRTSIDNVEDRIGELLEIVKHHSFDVFIPVMSGVSLEALSKWKNEFEKHTRLALPDFEQFGILNNKAEVAKLFTRLGIPGPKTYIAEQDSDLTGIIRNGRFPMIIKPYRGEGAKGVITISRPENLESIFRSALRINGPCIIQEYIKGVKHTAVYLLNRDSEVKRFFVHRAIREFPLSGGPTCFLESVAYDPIFPYGLQLLQHLHFSGLASMEFIADDEDGIPKIIDINPRIYGPIQCAISSGVDLPYDMFRMEFYGDIEKQLKYRTGVTCRHLLFDDTKHLISVLKGEKNTKYDPGKFTALLNYIKFWKDGSYFILSLSDPKPALRKVLRPRRNKNHNNA